MKIVGSFRARPHRGCFFILFVLAACGGVGPLKRPWITGKTDKDAGSRPAQDAGISAEDAGSTLLPMVDAAQPAPLTLVLSPDRAHVSVDLFDLKPIEFAAALSDGSPSASAVQWTSDHPELGALDPKTGAFTPTGAAGVVTITARTGSLFATTTLTIQVTAKQEGDPDVAKPAGAGGLGGVGGEGGGTPIKDPALRSALDASPTSDAELIWLYPYDGTVWPRGLAAPLLQWKHGAHAPLAVKIHIEVDKQAFTYDGYFAAPSGLAPGKPIDRLPIPQDVWRSALSSGSALKVALTIAASDGAGGFAAYVAAKNPSWSVAPTSLKGIVYYNSYGTALAKNNSGVGGPFGGATLSIQGDSFDPTLIAGADSSGCRVCHVVSAQGSRMIAQQSDNKVSSSYDLKNMNMETLYTDADKGKFAWAALSPDGALALGNAGPPGDDPSNKSSLDTTGLYRVSDAAVLTAQGLASFVTRAAMPVFSPDGKKVAFNLYGGPGNASIKADGNSLVVMDFKTIDPTTYEFSNPTAVFTGKGGDQRPGWPFFLPDGTGLVFELALKPGENNELFATRKGARGELWWTDLNGQAHALDQANGKGYLPSGPLGHDDDSTLQYEPTVAPIVAGGYAWVVFTSRRLYGNVATRDPYESDPRDQDLTSGPGNTAGPTTKKLWVTAIDVPAKPGSDPSHPAFYLPAQELYAGNSRGYWVLDACHENGKNCESGDQCCGGYCHAVEEFGLAICTDKPPGMCAKEFDSCNVDADCCRDGGSALTCIAGRCAKIGLF
jgi:hypothetical protein